MENTAIAITQKLLVNAGGWPAMKRAQQLHKAGRVTEADYTPPLLSGIVREGNRSLRSGLRVKSESDVENLCTCRESRDWGKLCPHALAVGLEFIERSTNAQVPAAASTPAVATRPPPGLEFVEIGTEGAKPLALHFILPPNLETAWAKEQIMVVTEVELDGKRVMPTALRPNGSYACDIFDLAAIDGLRESPANEPPLTPMRILPRTLFLRLLRLLPGHPRITFGRSTVVAISSEALRRRILLRRENDLTVSVRIELQKDERVLVAGEEAWLLQRQRLRPLVEGLPTEFREVLEGTLSLRGERAQCFLAFDAPRLREWFDLGTEGGWALPEVRKAVPHFRLNLTGSMRELRADLRVRYGEGMWEGPLRLDSDYAVAVGTLRSLSHSNAALAAGSSPQTADVIFVRDRDAEAEAVRRLESFDFTSRSDHLGLTGENRVARFFAFELSRLKEEWEVDVSAPVARASSELEPLAPTLEVVGSGENWFELRCSLGAPDGQTFSSAELRRLLRAGQSQARLRNGRTGVFDPAAMADFDEVLRDCEPEQSQPGVYRISRAHSQYVAATAQEVGARLSDFRGALSGLTSSEEPDLAPLLGRLGARLRAYQLDGLSWLWKLAQSKLGGILADEMGLGKTVQMLAFLLARRSPEPALIICPTSLITNWRNEAQRFAPELRVLVLEGLDRHARFAQIGESDLVLTSYALLQRDAEKFKAVQFSTVVLDEAQHIKNPETQNAQAAFALRARHRFVLTGTPMENSVRDLWSLMNFVLPGYLGSRADFRERYEQPLTRGAAPEVQRRLARRLRPFLLRRKKADVAKELPEKLEQQIVCDLTAPQRGAYDGLLREIQTGVASERGSAGAVRMRMLLGLLRLRQVCCDLRLLEKVGDGPAPGPLGGNDAFSRRREGAPGSMHLRDGESVKLELLEELLEEAIDGGHRVLVFSQFVAMLSLIRERLDAKEINYAYLDGQTRERQAVVDRFQEDDTLPVFLMSLKAGGVGLNLSAADTVIHFDPWWNYAAESQATDRAHRIGQTRIVTAYKLIARNTVEEKIVKLQARKRSASESLIGSEEPLMSGLTTKDLEELLS